MENDDFSIDFGIDMGDVDLSNGLFEGDNVVEKGKSMALTAIVAIVAGFIIIVIAFGIINIANKVENSKNIDNIEVEATSGNTIKSNGVNENSVKNNINNINSQIEKQSNIFDGVGVGSKRVNSENGGWVEFKSDGDSVVFEFSSLAVFEVTDIKHFVKTINNKNDKVIKSVAYGSISGLSGTYEVEIPYDKAVLLRNGSEFEIEYRYTIKDGIRIVGEIRY